MDCHVARQLNSTEPLTLRIDLKLYCVFTKQTNELECLTHSDLESIFGSCTVFRTQRIQRLLHKYLKVFRNLRTGLNGLIQCHEHIVDLVI